MRVYIVFKAKNMKAKKKEFIVDSLHTSNLGALKREQRLHNNVTFTYQRIMEKNTGVLKTNHQQTYIINKGLKGLAKGKLVQFLTEQDKDVEISL